MIRLKSNTVNLDKVCPKVYEAIAKTHEIYINAGAKDMVLTSVRDSKHGKGSLHYVGCAFDVRVWNLPKGIDYLEITKQIAEVLGKDYDVVFEVNHIHIEYDPK